MFQLTKNNFFTNGVCHYVDEHENKVTIRRTGDTAFAAKLRFSDGNIKAAPMNIDVEKVINDGMLGDTLHLDYSPDVEIDSEIVNSAIQSFTELLQYWIALFSDLRFSWTNNDILLKQLKSDTDSEDTWFAETEGDRGAATVQDIYLYKYNLLKKYKELAPVLDKVLR